MRKRKIPGYEKEQREHDRVLHVYKRSRKSFWVEYSCGFFLLLLLVIAWGQGIAIRAGIKYIVIGLALFVFLFAELSRAFLRYKITPRKLVILRGFIKQHKKNIYFHPLGFAPAINMHQSRFQRLLNYGTIYVHGQDNSFEIKDVDRPHKVMELVEDLIDENKNKIDLKS